MMTKNAWIYYNERENLFEIRTDVSNNVVCKKEGHYGIEFLFDINNKLIGLTIPDPDVVFGISSIILTDFDYGNLT